MAFRLARIIAAAALLMSPAPAWRAVAAPDDPAPVRVDDFLLADQDYIGRRLYKLKDARAVALISFVSDDPVSRAETGAYASLSEAYAGRGVEFLLIAPARGETRNRALEAAGPAGRRMPILFDYEQLVGDSLRLRKAGELVLIDPRTWTIAFRGPAGAASARRAIEALIAGDRPAFRAEPVKGGAIAYPGADPAQKAAISYAQDIAPLIREKCVGCHQPGGLGPMPFTSYEMIRGFAPMIREALRTKRMPPFQPDVSVGRWLPGEGLSSEQLTTLVRWIEAGAPRGEGEDPLAGQRFEAADWPLGPPDLVIRLPEVKVPASGVLEYTKQVLETGLEKGRWMRASAFRVTDRQALHHVTTVLLTPDAGGGVSAPRDSKGSLGGQGPGRTYNLVPDGMGVWMPAGSAIAFETHHTPYGRETVERTEMGFYFYPEGVAPTYPMRTAGLYDMGITIPAGAEHHPEVAYMDVPHDMLVYGLTPHAHMRGASTQVSVRRPDGSEELILAVPKYQFDWQTEYYLAEPLLVKAGSRIINRWTYDNSARNFANPEPGREVRFGEQTWEEMLTFFVHYRWVGETVETPFDSYDRQIQESHLMGVLDDNINGRLEPGELRGVQAERLKANFARLDADGNGALDRSELITRRSATAPAAALR